MVALAGFGLGLTSAVLGMAGGVVPIAPPLDLPQANDLVGVIHWVQFYMLAGIALGHSAFHIWRHVMLRDNALRLMAPKVLHRWLWARPVNSGLERRWLSGDSRAKLAI